VDMLLGLLLILSAAARPPLLAPPSLDGCYAVCREACHKSCSESMCERPGKSQCRVKEVKCAKACREKAKAK